MDLRPPCDHFFRTQSDCTPVESRRQMPPAGPWSETLSPDAHTSYIRRTCGRRDASSSTLSFISDGLDGATAEGTRVVVHILTRNGRSRSALACTNSCIWNMSAGIGQSIGRIVAGSSGCPPPAAYRKFLSDRGTSRSLVSRRVQNETATCSMACGPSLNQEKNSRP
jgi:hypothetical protein